MLKNNIKNNLGEKVEKKIKIHFKNNEGGEKQLILQKYSAQNYLSDSQYN